MRVTSLSRGYHMNEATIHTFCLGIKGKRYGVAFTYHHLTHKLLTLSIVDLPT
jgi:hypothetical protein